MNEKQTNEKNLKFIILGGAGLSIVLLFLQIATPRIKLLLFASQQPPQVYGQKSENPFELIPQLIKTHESTSSIENSLTVKEQKSLTITEAQLNAALSTNTPSSDIDSDVETGETSIKINEGSIEINAATSNKIISVTITTNLEKNDLIVSSFAFTGLDNLDGETKKQLVDILLKGMQAVVNEYTESGEIININIRNENLDIVYLK